MRFSMGRAWLILVFGLMLGIGDRGDQRSQISDAEFKRLRGPGDATTLRQYYRQINSLSADPVLNGSLSLFA